MPATPSIRQETILVPNGAVDNFTIAYNADIGFDSLSVAIDNFTGYWMYIPNAANPYVPPFYIGVVRNIVHATTRQQLQWASPFDATQNPIPAGAFASVTFTNFILPYALGSLAGIPSTPSGIGPPPINIYVTNDSFDLDFLTTVISVPVSPAAPLLIPTSILTSRKALMLQSSILNDQLIYVGGPTVTADEAVTGGAQLGPGQSFPIDTSIAVPYIITVANRATTTAQKIIVIEAA